MNTWKVLAIGGLMFAMSSPVLSVTVDVDVGRAEVKTDAFEARFVADPEFTVDIPSFSRKVSVISLGLRSEAAGIPLFATVFASDSDRFFRNYGGPPPLPGSPNGSPSLTVDHSVGVHGLRIGANPAVPIGDAWELDGLIGVQYMRTRVGHRPGLIGSPRKTSDIGLVAGVGASYRFSPRVGLRLGIDFAEDYRAATLGIRYRFD